LVKRNEESLEHYRKENQNSISKNNSKYKLNKSNSIDKISKDNSLSFKNNSFSKNRSNKSFEKEYNLNNSNSNICAIDTSGKTNKSKDYDSLNPFKHANLHHHHSSNSINKSMSPVKN